MTFRGRIHGVAPLVLMLCACNGERHPVPGPAAPVESARPPSSAEALPPGASVIPAEVVEAPPLEGGAADASQVDAGAADAAAEAGPPREPALRGPDGGVLPQTRDTPSVDSPLFRYHVELLFKAIQKDDPELGMTFFFPVLA